MKHSRWFLKKVDYDVTTIKIRNFRKGIIALTLEELIRLENVDASSSVEKQKAKDLFLLGCYYPTFLLQASFISRIIDSGI